MAGSYKLLVFVTEKESKRHEQGRGAFSGEQN